MENSVPYHCPKCRSGGEQAVFLSLPELRHHVLKVHLNVEPWPQASSSVESAAVPRANMAALTSAARLETGSIARGMTDAQQLAQAKRYLLKEAMKSSELSREQIRKLNEDIKIKEADLDAAIKRLGSVDERNHSMAEEFKTVEQQNGEIRRELNELRLKLAEKEKLLEEKNKELTEQMNYVKSMEEKEAVAKEKLERTVEKIIERAETAEKNLELMKLSRSAAINGTGYQEKETDFVQKNAELRDLLDSCNSASNAIHKQASSALPVEPNASAATPLVQVYLRNFLEKYNELKARDYAFNQALPTFPGVPQVRVNPYDSEHSQNGAGLTRQRTQAERDVLNPAGSKEPKPTDVYGAEEASVSRDRRPPSSTKNNVNNNNNYYSPRLNSNSQKLLSPTLRPASRQDRHSAMWSDYEDDDDDEPLTEISDDLEEEDHVPSRSKHNF